MRHGRMAGAGGPRNARRKAGTEARPLARQARQATPLVAMWRRFPAAAGSLSLFGYTIASFSMKDKAELRRIKAVILAGGLGTRISEETVARPKPMVEIGGRPVLWHVMKIYS